MAPTLLVVNVKILTMTQEALLVFPLHVSFSLTSFPNIPDTYLPQGLCTYCLLALKHSPGIHVVWYLFKFL